MSAPTRRPGTIFIRKDPSWDEHGWTSVPNAVLRDASLSWEARGAFAWMASHRLTFSLRSEDIAEAGPKGRNHARDMLRELEEHGWLTRYKERDSDTGRHELTIYNLHPIQVPKAQRTWTESTAKAAPALKAKLKPQVSPATGRTGAGRPGAERSVSERQGVSRARCLDSLEDHLLTEEEEHTPRERAVPPASPPCVTAPAQIKLDAPSLFETEFPVKDKESLKGGDAQNEMVYSKDSLADPFSGQHGDPDEAAAAVQGQKPRAASRATGKWQKTAHSPASEKIMNEYCEENRLSISTRARWLPEISGLLGQDFPAWAILEGIRICFRSGSGLGPTFLGEKTAAAMAQRSAPGKAASTEQRFDQIDDLLARRSARSATPGGSVLSSTPLQIEAQ